jgi:hypothetical protein
VNEFHKYTPSERFKKKDSEPWIAIAIAANLAIVD